MNTQSIHLLCYLRKGLDSVGFSYFRMKFLTWHLSLAKPRGLHWRRKREESGLSQKMCFHGNVEHVLVCMMSSHIHVLLSTLLLAKRCVCLHKLQMVQSNARLPLFLWCCKHEKVNSFTFMRISIIPTSILSLNRVPSVGHVLGTFST